MADNMEHKTGKVNQTDRDVRMDGSLLQAILRGWTAGTLGLPGGFEKMGRNGLIAIGVDVDKHPALPTPEFFKEWLPGKQVGDDAAVSAGELLGGMGAGTLIKSARGALTRAYADGGEVSDARYAYQDGSGDKTLAQREEEARIAAEQAKYTADHAVSRDDFLKKYGKTFIADDKGGNAASEVAGQDVADYYDKYLAPGAKQTYTASHGWDSEPTEEKITFGDGKYRDKLPYFDAYDNANPHPESQRGNGLEEAWRQVGRPAAVMAGMAFGAPLLFSGIGGATAAGAAAATPASGFAGMVGMDAGWAASALNSGALNTGMGLVRGQNIGDALKSGLTSAALSPVGAFANNATTAALGGYGLNPTILKAIGTTAGGTALGGAQALVSGKGLGKGLSDGLVNGLVASAGNYVGAQAKDATDSNFAGTAANTATQAALKGKFSGQTIQSLAEQYASGELTDLTGLPPNIISQVIALARGRTTPIGALTNYATSVGSKTLRKATVGD